MDQEPRASVTALHVSESGRHLVDQAGNPFLYVGDTNWTMLKRLYRSEIDELVATRTAQGFSALQAYVLRGLQVPNLYGDTTLVGDDPAVPNEGYFRNVDYAVERANQSGLVMAFVVSWGEHVKAIKSREQVFDERNAFVFGQFLGRRYQDNLVIWYLGGDRPPTDEIPIWVSMARGLKDGSQGKSLVSYHGPGDWSTPSSSYWFHGADWLDFNTIQSGHGWGIPCYDFIAHDYGLEPPKPTLNMEAAYENHPDARTGTRRVIDAKQTRTSMYWSLLAGGSGHAYGSIEVMQSFDPGRTPFAAVYDGSYLNNYPTMHWRDALHLEGAESAGVARRILERLDWSSWVPDQSLIADGQRSGDDHVEAARAVDGSRAIAYLPLGKPVSIQLGAVGPKPLTAYWVDPRSGRWTYAGESELDQPREFRPALGSDGDDWLLLLQSDSLGTPAWVADRTG